MDCKKMECLIQDFVRDKLDIKDLPQFLEHIEGCDSCKEELAIQYLLYEGMHHLEQGSTFDMQKELDAKIAASYKLIKTHRRITIFVYLVEILGIMGIIILSVMVISGWKINWF